MKIADYFYYQPDLQWDYAKQLGIRYAVGRMPDGNMEKYAENLHLLKEMKDHFKRDGYDFELKVLEPACSNQKIKQGLPGRDEEIDRMITLIRNMGKLGIEVLCMNFTAFFNWERTRFDYPERGGALACEFNYADFQQDRYSPVITHEQLWSNLTYLLKAIVPIAEEANVKIAIHPDDPPLPKLLNVGRILTSAKALDKALSIVPSNHLGLTFCQGTIGAMGENIVETIRHFGRKIFFVHFRDVRGTKECFHETFHDNGPTDMAAVIRAYHEIGFEGYGRVDHVPLLAHEVTDRPGYANTARLFAIGYLKGLLEMDGSLDE